VEGNWEDQKIISVSVFSSDKTNLGFNISASVLSTDVSPKRIWVETSCGVNGSSGNLALDYVSLGWYILLVDAVVCLRYPLGFKKILGSETGMVCSPSRFCLVFLRPNASLLIVESPSEKIKTKPYNVFNICSLSKR
jgi:hypothetical protein